MAGKTRGTGNLIDAIQSNSANDVVVGSANYTYKLNVKGNIGLYDSSDVIKVLLNSNGDSYLLGGKLGIGINPTYDLHIKRDYDGITRFIIDNSSATTGAMASMVVTSDNGSLYIYNFADEYNVATRTGKHEINSNATNGLNIVSTNGFTVQNTLSGTVYPFSIQNTKVGIGIKTAISTAHIYESTTATTTLTGLTIEQAGTGDVQLQFLLTGAQRWVAGIDNSDSDKFKIGRGNGWADGVDISVYIDGTIKLGTLTGYIKGTTGVLSASKWTICIKNK